MSGAVDEARLRRLAWRCRRGRRENDLVLQRFLDRHGSNLTEARLSALERLLDYTDNDLWDLVSGRAQPGDPEVADLVLLLRSC